jgi:hypothetical protein
MDVMAPGLNPDPASAAALSNPATGANGKLVTDNRPVGLETDCTTTRPTTVTVLPMRDQSPVAFAGFNVIVPVVGVKFGVQMPWV